MTRLPAAAGKASSYPERPRRPAATLTALPRGASRAMMTSDPAEEVPGMTDKRTPALSAERISMSIEELKALHGPPPWSVPLVANDRFLVMVICQAPGHRNDWHYHLVDECWSIYEGELAWTLEGRSEPVRVKAGEWIFAPANTFHLIEVLGEQPAIRIAITPAGEYHRHERADAPPAPPAALR
jgi:quercetin dioxygenase-like cupin family protein